MLRIVSQKCAQTEWKKSLAWLCLLLFERRQRHNPKTAINRKHTSTQANTAISSTMADPISAVSNIISTAVQIRRMCERAKACRALVDVVERKMASLIPVMQEIRDHLDEMDNRAVMHLTAALAKDIRDCRAIVQRASQMSKISYIVHSNDLREQIERNLRAIHLALMSLQASQNTYIIRQNKRLAEEFRKFHLAWKQREKELRREEERESKLKSRVAKSLEECNQRGASDQARRESVAKAAGINVSQVKWFERELTRARADHDRLVTKMKRDKDSVARSKAKADAMLMDQIITALAINESMSTDQASIYINITEANDTPIEAIPVPLPAEEGEAEAISNRNLPEDCLCPITNQVMDDPIIVDANCHHTMSREAAKRWFSLGKTTCPVCGIEVGSHHLSPNVQLRNVTESLMSGGVQQYAKKDRQGHTSLFAKILLRRKFFIFIVLVFFVAIAVALVFGLQPDADDGGDSLEDGGDSLADGGDPLGCHVLNPHWIGNGKCDGGDYNTKECNWDGGDCLIEGLPDCHVDHQEYIGSGTCGGGVYNTRECGWDGGDCSVEGYPDCHVRLVTKLGDGTCDDGDYNTAGCSWDGGDCYHPDFPDCHLDDLTNLDDDYCDHEYNIEECGWDGEDCIYFNEKYPNCTVPFPEAIGDGWCDKDGYNTVDCGWDGGDCTKFNRRFPCCEAMYSQWFREGTCLGCGDDECDWEWDCSEFVLKYPGCRVILPSLIGDGVCDGLSYNTAECGWDGGDCIEFNNMYPDCNVTFPDRIGDGTCNSGVYNTAECGWDGEDCLELSAQHGLYPNCPFDESPETFGNGVCDNVYNNAECGWDYGDCEFFNSLNLPDCQVNFPSKIGDGYCHLWQDDWEIFTDDINYMTPECNYDGGDCLEFQALTDRCGDDYGDCIAWREYNDVTCHIGFKSSWGGIVGASLATCKEKCVQLGSKCKAFRIYIGKFSGLFPSPKNEEYDCDFYEDIFGDLDDRVITYRYEKGTDCIYKTVLE